MVEGLPDFVASDTYGGMVKSFASSFGDTIDIGGNVPAVSFSKDGMKKLAGIVFYFTPGAVSDFPAASILIGGKVYYLHFTPVAGMHMGPLQITGRATVDAYLSEMEKVKASKAELFTRGHGIATVDVAAVDFPINYLKIMKGLMEAEKKEEDFVSAMKTAFPEVAALEDLTAVAANLYK